MISVKKFLMSFTTARTIIPMGNALNALKAFTCLIAVQLSSMRIAYQKKPTKINVRNARLVR
jgi:hypothetical protein